MKFLGLCLLSFLTTSLLANDGVFYVSGNQLIPMTENKITVKKEILNIKRIDGDNVEVNVYYEFYNPDESRNLVVGFEAAAPSGDVYDWNKTNGHPFIYRFSVLMNGHYLPHEIATVQDSLYYRNGQFLSRSIEALNPEESDYADFMYVYHFKGRFIKGINRISHSYICKLSNSVATEYDFTYVLSAAARWGNKQIDDFTLNIDMGSFQYFRIVKSFFKHENEWILAGKGKLSDADKTFCTIDAKSMNAYLESGTLVFQKLNFKPLGELQISANRSWCESEWVNAEDTFSSTLHKLPFVTRENTISAADEFSLKLLKNLPFARRGYVFENIELQKWFEQMPWYVPDPGYSADLSLLSSAEQEWLKNIRICK